MKKHKWFANIVFSDLEKRAVTPPIKPECGKEDDTANFECVLRPFRFCTTCSCTPMPLPAFKCPPPLASYSLPVASVHTGRKYPDSEEGSHQAIDARDQALFEDF